MAKQDYILKKYVRADSAADAIALDTSTPVSEAFLVADKPNAPADAVGFKTVLLDEY